MRDCTTCCDVLPCEACEEGRRLAAEGFERLRPLDGGFEVALPLAPVLRVAAGPLCEVPWTLRAPEGPKRAAGSQLVLW